LRFFWVYTLLLLGLLLNTALPDDPVCLDKSEEYRSPAFVVFSPDGNWIAAMTNEEVLVWDFATNEKVAVFTKPHEERFVSIAFAPDSRHIAYLDAAGRVGLWDGSTGWADAPEREILGPLIGPDGQRLSSGARSGEDMTISPDGKLLAVPRVGGVIKIVEIVTGKDVGELAGRILDEPKFTNHGKTLLVDTSPSAREGWCMEFWNMESFEAEKRLRIRPPRGVGKGYGITTALSPAEDMLGVVVGNANNITEVRLYELPSGRWSTLMKYQRRIICDPCFSPDGRLLAVPTERGPGDPAAVLVWDLIAKTWRRFDCPSKIAQQNIAFMNAKFSPDGRYLAGSLIHPEVAVCIWDLQEDADKSESSGVLSRLEWWTIVSQMRHSAAVGGKMPPLRLGRPVRSMPRLNAGVGDLDVLPRRGFQAVYPAGLAPVVIWFADYGQSSQWGVSHARRQRRRTCETRVRASVVS
jgi:WD40 repeat protein